MNALVEESATRKMAGRVYTQVPCDTVQIDDIIDFHLHRGTERIGARGLHTRRVVSVAKGSVLVDQPKGLQPPTKRVKKEDIVSCWRWHKHETD